MAANPGFGHLVGAQWLATIGLFGALSEDTLQYLAETLRVDQLNPGENVFREGDRAAEMFVVLSGEFEVLKKSKRGVEARVAMLGDGDWFGEMSILDVQPRSATIRALSPSRLMVIAASDLDVLYRRDTKSYAILILNIARELSRRLRVADGILADLVVNVIDDIVLSKHGSAT